MARTVTNLTKLHVQNHFVLVKLKCNEISLRTFRVHEHTVGEACLESELHGLNPSWNWITKKIQAHQTGSIEEQRLSNVIATVKLNSKRDSVLPSGWIDSNPLCDDCDIKNVVFDLIAVFVAFEKLEEDKKLVSSNAIDIALNVSQPESQHSNLQTIATTHRHPNIAECIQRRNLLCVGDRALQFVLSFSSHPSPLLVQDYNYSR